MSIEQKLSEKNLQLPAVGPALGAYVDTVRTGNLVYVSGKLPLGENGLLYSGKVGQDLSLEQAYEAASVCFLHILACVKAEIGDLEKIKRLVRLNGFVASGPEFHDAPKVINGASELAISLLGDKGKHTRIALSVAALPLNAPVEIDAILEVE